MCLIESDEFSYDAGPASLPGGIGIRGAYGDPPATASSRAPEAARRPFTSPRISTSSRQIVTVHIRGLPHRQNGEEGDPEGRQTPSIRGFFAYPPGEAHICLTPKGENE